MVLQQEPMRLGGCFLADRGPAAMSMMELGCNYVLGVFCGGLFYSPVPPRILVLLAKLDAQDQHAPRERTRAQN
jgi:hypothetical protein